MNRDLRDLAAVLLGVRPRTVETGARVAAVALKAAQRAAPHVRWLHGGKRAPLGVPYEPPPTQADYVIPEGVGTADVFDADGRFIGRVRQG